MATQTTTQPSPLKEAAQFIRTLLRGSGQVMFQCSAWTGLFFLFGIFWGSYATGHPLVAWGALVGLVSSTLAGYALRTNDADGAEGLWGFNGILVGCAFPTFLGNTWLMWLSLIFCAALTTWMRRGFNNATKNWNINSLTFPFVFLTWVFLLCSRIMPYALEPSGLSTPELADPFNWHLDTSFQSLVVYWLKGISEVFLVDNWVTGIFFLVGLVLCNCWAGFYAALASAISLGLAILFHANPHDIANGLFSFSPVLTGIAVGMTFYKVNWKSGIWTVCAIVATFFVQAAMDIFLQPYGIPTLTGPFCVATWLFLLPNYRLDDVKNPNHTIWHSKNRKARKLSESGE